ncbi:IS110 family RNA-guided transposase [Sphingosinicella rhizophila]|uniref:IS110 family transposase n=1 Tax=Sphingosinicella rhizophila TaxID=3050082 RepID=A0ABU3Q5G0_9SPHN|nr:IS110 family transposase [Sphingosinicella sp. GR2756]MDT9598650.1 IS110 family transposase [Sphingosinicella sp. GR2756]
MTFWVGLDLGGRETKLCVVGAQGEVIHERYCPSDAEEIHAALSAFPIEQIQLVSVEAGGGTHIVRRLRAFDYPVAIFEARTASKFLKIRRDKTDDGDARGLADLGRLGQSTVSRVRLKGLERQQLRSRLMVRHKLVRHRVAVDNVIRDLLTLYGGTWKRTEATGGTRIWGQEQIELIKAAQNVDRTAELCPLIELSEALQSYLKETDKWLLKRAEGNPLCRRFMEIPGVGPICALSFYTAIEDPFQFPKTSSVGSFFGLAPTVSQSGTRETRKGISKMGSRLTRMHLFVAANTFFSRYKEDAALRSWALGLAGRIGKKKAKIALARTLAMVMLAMWKDGSSFDLNHRLGSSPPAPADSSS